MIRHIFLLLALALGSAASLADTPQTLRCGTRLVGEGDHQARVAALCGRPDHVSERTIHRVGPADPSPRLDGRYWTRPERRELLRHERSVVEVPVDVWVYNLGPNRLMREIVFEDGRVVGLESLGYGY